MRVKTFDSYASLPATFGPLFSDAHSGNLFHSREWLQNAARNGLRPGDRLRLFAVEADRDGAPVALLPAIYSRLYPAHPQARVIHFLQPEDLPYVPLLPAEGTEIEAVIDSVVAFLRARPDSYDIVRVSPLEPGSRFATALAARLRRSGHAIQTYAHLADRFEETRGQAYNDYLSRRPRDLREELGRHTRLLLGGGRGAFEMACIPEHLPRAYEPFMQITAKVPVEGEPEPPSYLASSMRVAADVGALRLGWFYLDGVPVAMQLWMVTAGKAHCLRIWGVQGPCAFPIDEVLTHLLTVYLIEADTVDELDFGGVTEEFGRSWATGVRQRIGVAAFNLRTWRGIKGAARHIGVQSIKSVAGHAWRRVTGGSD